LRDEELPQLAEAKGEHVRRSGCATANDRRLTAAGQRRRWCHRRLSEGRVQRAVESAVAERCCETGGSREPAQTSRRDAPDAKSGDPSFAASSPRGARNIEAAVF